MKKLYAALLAIVITGGCSYAWKLNGWGLNLDLEGTKGAPDDAGAPLAVPAHFDAGA